MPAQGDSAARRTDTYYAIETQDARGRPVTPDNPSWRLYSTVVRNTEPSPEKEFGHRTGIGRLVPFDKNQAQESHEMTVEYELERAFVDGNGDPIDPFADAAVLTDDNAIGVTHSFYQRVIQGMVQPRNTVHAKWFARDDVDASDHPTGAVPEADSRPRRKVIYGRGGIPEEPTLGVNADDDSLAIVEYGYQYRKMRAYETNDPNGSSPLHVMSDDQADTGAPVTIENEDASTAETVSLDGADATTPVTTTTGFGEVERINVPDEHDGAILVFDDDGAGNADQLIGVVKGANRYDGIEADHGPAALGSGSFDTGETLERKQYALGAELYWCGEPVADYHQGTSVELSFDLGDEPATNTGFGIPRQAGALEVSAEVTAFGETASHDSYNDFLEGRMGVLELRLNDADVTLPLASPSEGGPAAREEGEAFLVPETTFVGYEDIDAGRPVIEFTRHA